MENEQLDLNNLTKEDFMAMAEYVAHTEAINNKLLEDLREAKSSLLATLQQRNSLNARLQNIMLDRVNTIDVSAIKTEIINTQLDLINPEQYREKKNQR
jgi:flagellar biosynthesis/type III secretory pathway chaperone